MLKGSAELNEGDASLLKEADGWLAKSKEASEQDRVLAEDKEAMVAKLCSLRACYNLLTQEKVEQDEELQLVHEDKEGLAAELQALKQRRS